jgi:hypothetical protein
MGFVRGALLHQSFRQTLATGSHSAHRSPIRKFTHQALQDQRFAVNVNRQLRSGL